MRTTNFMILATAILLTSFALNAEELSGVDMGFRWLSKHQEPDGHWDSLKYGASKKSDIATTSIALLAFGSAGHSEKLGEHKGSVKRAVTWLISKQSESGRIIDASDVVSPGEEAWGSTLAALAIFEATSLANEESTRAAAQKAVSQLVEDFPYKNTKGVDGATIYEFDEKADTATVGWVATALKSAKIAGLHVPHGAFDPVVKYLGAVEHKLGADSKGSIAASEFWYSKKDRIGDGHPAYRINAIACFCKQLLGTKREDLFATVQHFVDQSGVPVWNKDAENVDFYYWFFATLCSFQYRRIDPEEASIKTDVWSGWTEPEKKAIWDHQCLNGDDTGSWNAHGFASRRWGRVGQTALACLCMTIYWHAVAK